MVLQRFVAAAALRKIGVVIAHGVAAAGIAGGGIHAPFSIIGRSVRTAIAIPILRLGAGRIAIF